MEDRPRQEDFETKPDYRQARSEWAKKLAGLKPKQDELPQIKEAIELLTGRVIELENILARKDTVHLENGASYDLEAADHLSLALAAILASRGVEVDLPLRSGKVIPKLRISEIVQIATQLQAGGHESEPSHGPSSEPS